MEYTFEMSLLSLLYPMAGGIQQADIYRHGSLVHTYNDSGVKILFPSLFNFYSMTKVSKFIHFPQLANFSPQKIVR